MIWVRRLRLLSPGSLQEIMSCMRYDELRIFMASRNSLLGEYVDYKGFLRKEQLEWIR